MIFIYFTLILTNSKVAICSVLWLLIILQSLAQLSELFTGLGYIWFPEKSLLQLVGDAPVLGQEARLVGVSHVVVCEGVCCSLVALII